MMNRVVKFVWYVVFALHAYAWTPEDCVGVCKWDLKCWYDLTQLCHMTCYSARWMVVVQCMLCSLSRWLSQQNLKQPYDCEWWQGFCGCWRRRVGVCNMQDWQVEQNWFLFCVYQFISYSPIWRTVSQTTSQGTIHWTVQFWCVFGSVWRRYSDQNLRWPLHWRLTTFTSLPRSESGDDSIEEWQVTWN